MSDLTLRMGQGGDPVGGSFWAAVGGRPTFEKLVRAFYTGVRGDDVLWPMYPEDDLEGAVQRLTGFLEQYWGGPGTYSEQRGHPRLRMRHMPFAVTPLARDRWLQHMRAAVDTLGLAPLQESMLWDYLERAAHAMVNSADSPAADSPASSPADPSAGSPVDSPAGSSARAPEGSSDAPRPDSSGQASAASS